MSCKQSNFLLWWYLLLPINKLRMWKVINLVLYTIRKSIVEKSRLPYGIPEMTKLLFVLSCYVSAIQPCHLSRKLMQEHLYCVQMILHTFIIQLSNKYFKNQEKWYHISNIPPFPLHFVYRFVFHQNQVWYSWGTCIVSITKQFLLWSFYLIVNGRKLFLQVWINPTYVC